MKEILEIPDTGRYDGETICDLANTIAGIAVESVMRYEIDAQKTIVRALGVVRVADLDRV